MPKLKTKSGVKKRFKFTATGKVKHGVAGKRQLNERLIKQHEVGSGGVSAGGHDQGDRGGKCFEFHCGDVQAWFEP